MRVHRALLAALVTLLVAAPAGAQSAPPSTELAVTAGALGAVSFGSRDAELIRPNGSPLVIFRAENRLAPGYALEVHIGGRLTDRLGAEATGGWHKASFETRITDDIEDAEPLTVTQTSNRFTVEGAVLYDMLRRERLSLFLRGGAGWMRELAGESSLIENGIIANVGVGVKYWWSDRVGLRAEGRASARSAGISLGEDKVRIGPVAAAGLIVRF